LGIFHGSPAPPRELRYTQAKVLGGGSSINAQVYTRGNARDYDDWAARGATGWSYAEVLPYFKRAEDNQRFVDIYHARRPARRLIARQSASNQRSLSPGRSGIRNSLQSRFQMPSRRASDIIR
jgi:choline dehydrogenase-like flavoprotein